MKIKKSDLARMSQDELLQVAREAMKIKDSFKSRTLETYLETAHKSQLEFHKNDKRIRYFLGGNRCLIDSSPVYTLDGVKAIGDIRRSAYYASFDQQLNQYLFALGGTPFPKAKESLYRVVHTRGEFVSSGQHLVALVSGDYEPVSSLTAGDTMPYLCAPEAFSSLAKTKRESFLKELSLDGSRCFQTHEDCPDDYGECTHQYGRQLPLEVKIDQEQFRRSHDALVSILSAGPFESSAHADVLAGLRLICSRLDRQFSPSGFEDYQTPYGDPTYSLFEDLIFSEVSGRALASSLQLQQSDRKYLSHLIGRVKVGSGVGLALAGSITVAPDSSTVISVEKLGRCEWIWDLQVPGFNNYVADGIVHHNSGKTTAGTVEMIWRCMGNHPFQKMRIPIKAAIVLQDFENHGKAVIEPKIAQWAPQGAITKTDRNQTGAMRKYTFSTGSTLDIFSHDQDKKTFEGSDFDVVWFDEPPPQDIFNSMWRGLTDRGGFAYITGTPIVGAWMYNEFKKAEQGDDLRWCIFVDTEENAFNLGEGDLELGKKRIRDFASTLLDDEKESRLHGKFLQLRGLIFKEWDRKIHLLPEFQIPAQWPIYESIDNHSQKPWAVSWMCVAPNGCKILLRSGLYEGTIEDVANSILLERTFLNTSNKTKPNIIKTLIDNSASVPLWQKSNMDRTDRRVSVREELEHYIGPRSGGPPVTVAPKNVSQKIQIFRQWLRPKQTETSLKCEFYAFDIEENAKFIEEIESYQWDTKKGGLFKGLKDQPVKTNDDILDTIMQVALTMPKHVENAVAPTTIKTMERPKWTI